MPSECFFFSERSPCVNFDKVMGVICSAEKRHLLFRANLSAWIHANIGTQSAVPVLVSRMPFFSFAAPSGKYAVGQEDAMWVDRYKIVHVGSCARSTLCIWCMRVCLFVWVCVYESFVQSQGKKLVVRLFYPCDASEAKICRYWKDIANVEEWYCTDNIVNTTNVCWCMLTYAHAYRTSNTTNLLDLALPRLI